MRLNKQLLIVLLCLSAPLHADIRDRPPMVTATSWAVAEGQEIRFSKSADTLHQIASLTKLMTSLVVMETLSSEGEARELDGWLQRTVVVSKAAATISGTSALLETGDRLTVQDLLYALLLPSGNDAAVALSEYAGRRMSNRSSLELEARVIEAMNDKAQLLGMSSTTFVDVHGMGENYSTARDLVLLTHEFMDTPILREIVGATEYTVEVRSGRGTSRTRLWRNTNQLLGEFHGVKTGHTNLAGGCLILSGEYSGKTRRVIVLGSSNQSTRFMDAFNIFQWSLR